MDPLFMDGMTDAEAEYARNEWMKQVVASRAMLLVSMLSHPAAP
jgi:hypothetical protein